MSDDNDDGLEPIELGQEQPRRLTSDATALAANWKTVLLVDSLAGVILLVIGAWVTIGGHTLGGPIVAGCGAAYVTLIAKRYRRWRRIRRAANLH